jgi:hypothetical protein
MASLGSGDQPFSNNGYSQLFLLLHVFHNLIKRISSEQKAHLNTRYTTVVYYLLNWRIVRRAGCAGSRCRRAAWRGEKVAHDGRPSQPELLHTAQQAHCHTAYWRNKSRAVSGCFRKTKKSGPWASVTRPEGEHRASGEGCLWLLDAILCTVPATCGQNDNIRFTSLQNVNDFTHLNHNFTRAV